MTGVASLAKSPVEHQLQAALTRRESILPVLASLSGVDLLGIQDLACRPNTYRLRVVNIQGKERAFHIPCTQLAAVQRVLAKLPYKVHDAAHGYVKGRSIITNAGPHAGAQAVLHCDLKDFFLSVRLPAVMKALQQIGVPEPERKILSGILTCLVHGQPCLPQGAPSSPALANAVLFDLDCTLTSLAGTFRAQYTRYVDDLTFSGDLSTSAAWRLLRRARRAITREGYSLSKKTTLKKFFQRQTVVGLTVNNGRLRVPREFRRRIRAALHHYQNPETCNVDPSVLRGWIEYVAMVDPDEGDRLRAQLVLLSDVKPGTVQTTP